MNSRIYNGIAVVLFLSVALLTSACGTLQIDTAPGASGAEATGSMPEVSQPTPVTTAEAIPSQAEADDVVEETQPLTGVSEITELDETWNQFTDYRRGFSIRFPKKMVTFRGSCTWNEDQGSFRPELAPVPVRIFEDANDVYIAAEHYYELAGERQVGGKAYYDECNLVTNSLELLQEPDAFKEPYWQLVVEDIHNDAELDSFIKERYFPGCSLGEQLPSLQDGVVDVRIQGDGKDLAESQCPLNFATVLKYFPAGNKVVAWDRGQSYYFPADVNYSVVYDQEMEDSFRFLTETSTEVGPEPLETVGYSNNETGISFSYPTSWAMEEEANAFVFRNGPVVLRVGYRMPGDTADIWGRTGMGGTDVVALEGTAQFLDQILARYGVNYEDLLIAVTYGGEPGAVVQSGAMEFTIVLDDPDTDYQTLTITDEIMAEAEMILASFEVGLNQAGPFGELLSYTNLDYGFTLHYPSTWTVEEVTDAAFVGPGSRSVQLRQGTVKLVIGYRRIGEEAAIGGSGAPGGEFEVRGTAQMLDQDVERYVIVYEGKDKVVMYGQPGPPTLSAGGLEFALRMDDFDPDYDSVELSQTLQNEADMIASSLAIIEVERESDSSMAGEDDRGWQTYTNEQLGYSLMFPGAAEVVSLDPSQRAAFIGPEVDGKPQFQFMIVHYDIDAVEAANFMQSLAEGHRDFLESIGETTIGQVEELVIAGEAAIKLRFPAINESEPRDDYLFIHGGKMFTISITHFAGLENQELSDRFLQSITFEQS